MAIRAALCIRSSTPSGSLNTRSGELAGGFQQNYRIRPGSGGGAVEALSLRSATMRYIGRCVGNLKEPVSAMTLCINTFGHRQVDTAPLV